MPTPIASARPKRFLNPSTIIVHKVQANDMSVILNSFAKTNSQPDKSARRYIHSQAPKFHIAG